MTMKDIKTKLNANIEKVKAHYALKKIERDKFVKALNPKSFDFQVATWFGSGLMIPAPGTWGTAGGFIFGMIVWHMTSGFFVFMIALMLFLLGLRVIERLERNLREHDSSFIVIDEVVAILLIISFNALILSWMNVEKTHDVLPWAINIITFLLFRYFDAQKPGVIGTVDQRTKDEWGVMMDDILAAVYTMGATILMFLGLSIFTFLVI